MQNLIVSNCTTSQSWTSRFYRSNNVKRFLQKRGFHKGPKDKSNEFVVSVYCAYFPICMYIWYFILASMKLVPVSGMYNIYNC